MHPWPSDQARNGCQAVIETEAAAAAATQNNTQTASNTNISKEETNEEETVKRCYFELQIVDDTFNIKSRIMGTISCNMSRIMEKSSVDKNNKESVKLQFINKDLSKLSNDFENDDEDDEEHFEPVYNPRVDQNGYGRYEETVK